MFRPVKVAVSMLLLIIAVGLTGCSSSPKEITKAKYDRISNGMSYKEVVQVIGKEGEELSSSNVPAIPGVMASITTKMYMWKNSDGSNMNAMFQNDKLMQKAQFGLN